MWANKLRRFFRNITYAVPTGRRAIVFGAGSIGILLLGLFLLGLRAPQSKAETERFVVAPDATRREVVAHLVEDGFIRNKWAFALVLWGGVKPGAYHLAKDMPGWQVARVLEGKSYMKWIKIPEGLRKEETANILANSLEWEETEKEEFLNAYQTLGRDYKEGVYFPDTYLLPVDEGGAAIAERVIDHFNEKFEPYADAFLKDNIKWTTALKLASIVQREAAGEHDMPLIAGILWNRLDQSMKLEVDATVQYVRGETEKGWWAPIKSENRQINSPYNTYRYLGLPPSPIANPGTAAIKAVLNPQKTSCLYYIHDSSRQIHCAKTFDEHRRNIEIYLR